MYLKLRSEYTTKNDSMQLRLLSDIFDITTQKSTSVHKKIDILRTLNFQLGNLDQDLKFHDKALAMILLKSMGDEFETTRDMIMISARKSSVTIDDIVNILASKETELNDLSIVRNETSDVVNYASKNKGQADSRANSKSSSNYHKPLYCTFHRQTIGHIQNDCPDYLKTEPGKKWLRSDAGLAWVKGASKRKNKGHNIRFRGIKGRTTNNDESSDDDNAVLNMVSSLNTGEVYETDDSAYSYFPRKTVFAVPELTRPHDWYLDTCASRHITPNRDFFIPGSLKPHKISIKCANKSLISSRGIGDVNIVWEDDNRTSRNITIRDVLYIPEAGDNLISIGMLTKKVSRTLF